MLAIYFQLGPLMHHAKKFSHAQAQAHVNGTDFIKYMLCSSNNKTAKKVDKIEELVFDGLQF